MSISYPKVILVHGLKEAGKTTIADHLIEKHGYMRVKLAGPLKEMTRALLRSVNISEDLIEQYVEGGMKETPVPELGGILTRRIMETIGEEWRNLHGFLLWTNITVSRIQSELSRGNRVVVDDLRYPFELEHLTKCDPSTLTFVVTRGNKHFEPVEKGRPAAERPLPVELFDSHFKNNASTQELWNSVDKALMEGFVSTEARRVIHQGLLPTIAA